MCPRVLLSRHPWHASSHYPRNRPPPPPPARHKIPKMCTHPNLSKLPTEVQSGCFAQSNCIQHPPFAFPKNQLEAGLLKKMHFVSPAGCAMHQAWSDAVGECIETGEELHQGLGRRGCLVSVHLAIMSASPYLHSIAFSIWETRGTRSSESIIIRFPNPLLKSFDPFY